MCAADGARSLQIVTLKYMDIRNIWNASVGLHVEQLQSFKAWVCGAPCDFYGIYQCIIATERRDILLCSLSNLPLRCSQC